MDNNDLRVNVSVHSCTLQCSVRLRDLSSFTMSLNTASGPDDASVYDMTLSNDEKTHVLRTMLSHSLLRATYSQLVSIAVDHGLRRRKRDIIWQDLLVHSCSWSCLIHRADAVASGHSLVPLDAMMDERPAGIPPVDARLAGGPNDDYDYALSREDKVFTFQFLLRSSLRFASYAVLLAVATEHGINRQRHDLLRQAMNNHDCCWNCLIRRKDFFAAKQLPPEMATEDEVEAPGECDAAIDDAAWWKDHWPQVESWDTLKTVCSLLST
ncbi:hypothetical protein BDZ89DRAFT_444320 [Hymenopellis radicata]|nr:hypothetical protein BDZ89DRAFT_444320 [Hymenopellis radicata]